MTRIIGIAGSLRRGSYNRALLGAAAELAPAGTTIEIASIADIPLYDGDREARAGVPAPVAALQDAIAGADGLLLATPEYNHSVPGVLKNAIDWLTRPPAAIPRVFGGRAVALMGATPGRGGTRLAQAAWLPILRTLGTRPWFGRELYVADAGKVFDAEGNLVDAKVRELLSKLVTGFASFAADRGPAGS
jgi:chromate reductase, NAD(P)H dehydrogenase (quinone)